MSFRFSCLISSSEKGNAWVTFTNWSKGKTQIPKTEIIWVCFVENEMSRFEEKT
jgi:hypothetical protein